MAPTSRPTLLSQRLSRKSAAPAPRTSILANDVSSNRAAASRQARCSAPIAGDQTSPAHPRPEPTPPPHRPQRPDAGHRVRLEPVRAPPAGLLAEGRAQLL